MPFDPSPANFFGPGYTFASNTVSLTIGQPSVALGDFATTTPTPAPPADETLLPDLTKVAHGLSVGDRVTVAAPATGTLPAQLVPGVVYYVVATPSANVINISTALNGAPVLCSYERAAAVTKLVGVVDNLDTDEANPAMGDWRDIVHSLVEALYQRYNALGSNAPRQLVIERAPSIERSSGNLVHTYSISCKLATSPAPALADEV